MADIIAGRRLERIRLLLVRGSVQSFALSWNDAQGAPLSLAGKTATITLDSTPPVTWTATNNASVTTWSLSAAQTALPQRTYSGRLVIADADGAIVAYSITAELQ
jgi:hypothetical protein